MPTRSWSATSGDDTAAGTDAGSAYVFTRSGTVWTEQQRFSGDDTLGTDQFGNSVALDGDTAVVGARLDNAAAGSDVGAAYVFTRGGGAFSQQAKLTASDPLATAMFGNAVAVSGATVLVGCSEDSRPELDTGSAYVFANDGSGWTQRQKLVATDQDARLDAFGTSAAVDGTTVVVGAPNDDLAGLDAGTAYVFVRNQGEVTLQQKLTAPNASAGDQFGTAVAVFGDTLVVGAFRDDTVQGNDAGSAYVFTRSGSVWNLQQQLTASDGAAGDYFGQSVALSGETVVVGAWGADIGGSSSVGAAYVFTRSGGVWTQQKKLTAADGAASDYFGRSVAISGDTALVGADGSDVGATNQGTAYVFVRSGTTWTQQAKLLASDAVSTDTDVSFGYSVALDGNTALVGAYQDTDGTKYDAGAAYVYTRSGTTWSQQQKLTPSDLAAYDYFGRSVSLWGITALIGAPSDDVGTLANVGSAYVFTRNGTTWSQQQKWTASDATIADAVGETVALGSGIAVVAATGSNVLGANAGAAYVIAELPDCGDAPTAAQSGFAGSYPTKLADDGARHWPTGPMLGASRDAEGDGRPTADANGDDTSGSDDEDGVVWVSRLTPGTHRHRRCHGLRCRLAVRLARFQRRRRLGGQRRADFHRPNRRHGHQPSEFLGPRVGGHHESDLREVSRDRFANPIVVCGAGWRRRGGGLRRGGVPGRAQVGGRKWSDTDGDGVWDTGESPLAGVTVYLDTDDDGQWDSGEPKQVTAADGSYRFAALAAGTYIVREQVPAGTAQTYPGAAPPETHRASVASDGTQTNGQSNHPTLSAGGRYVAFESIASNLVPGDTNGVLDIFLHDAVTGVTQRISTGIGGAQANSQSLEPQNQRGWAVCGVRVGRQQPGAGGHERQRTTCSCTTACRARSNASA